MSTKNFTGFAPGRSLIGLALFKEAPDVQEKALDKLTEELSNVTTLLAQQKSAQEQQYTDLTTHFSGVKGDNEELRKTVKKHVDDYAELSKNVQFLEQVVNEVKKELDAPIVKGGKDLEDSDRRAAIELQRRAFLFKGGPEADFKEDTENLVNAAQYRSAVKKLMSVGIDSKERVLRTLTEGERKAFDAASLDSAFFSPELLGIELDCTVECAELLDLYDSVTVSKSSFMFPRILDWGAIGQYDCDAKCDAEFGPEGNIAFKNDRTYDFRGVFCFNRKVLAESNYDLLNFMFRSAARSYRINRNRALIAGDGINEPQGWLTADCFPKLATQPGLFNHVAFRKFLAMVPTRYGRTTVTMHDNVFAYLASAVDSNGRFIFGDGLMSYTPNDVRENIRISDCLPDPTAGGTIGDAANPIPAGSFIAAAGAWPSAYASVNKRPMWIEQFEGGSTAWCVKYVFGAEDGGFVKCCDAARVLVAG